MNEPQRRLWRGTAVFIFLTAILGTAVFFALGLVFEVSPDFWNVTDPVIPRSENMAGSQRSLFFGVMVVAYLLPQVLLLVSLRLVRLCVIPNEWVIFGQLLMTTWQTALIGVIISGGAFFIGLSFPEEKMVFQFVLFENQYIYPLSLLAQSTYLLLVGIGAFRVHIFPRLLSGGTVFMGALSALMTPFLTNPDTFVFRAQPQIFLIATATILIALYLFRGAQVDEFRTPTTVGR